MSTSRFPLAWPDGWPRTPAAARSHGNQFRTMATHYSTMGTGSWRSGKEITVEVARKKLIDELVRLGARSIVLSSNIPLRSDGMPRSDAARYRMDDPGVAIYFLHRGKQMAMACDRFDQLERHGGGVMMERAFAGFAALPPPRTCWEILGVSPGADRAAIDAAFRRLAHERHPDRGGSDDDMAELNRARSEALRKGG